MKFTLGELGLKHVQRAHALAEWPNAQPMRVAAVHRGAVDALGNQGTLTLAHEADDDTLTVGDWVAVEHGRMVGVLPRTNWLRRRAVASSRAQWIAANVDVVFVVCAFASTEKHLQRNLNPRRLERYLLAVREGGALPVVVVNKADLCLDPERYLDELQKTLSIDAVVAVSAEHAELSALREWIRPGDTVAFVGSSGVGKSSLINQLTGREAGAVGAVRATDNKGKHTTTRRELFKMPEGALLIDTPGMRQLGVYLDNDSQAVGFEEIDELAHHCRFTDCDHDGEPDCAVAQAVEEGALSAERLQSFRSLRGEALRQRARTDAYARHLQNKNFKQLSKRVRQALRRKGL